MTKPYRIEIDAAADYPLYHRKRCSHCNRPFLGRGGSVWFCSTECQQAARAERRREKHQAEIKRRPAPKPVICACGCGHRIRPPQRSTRRYFEDACRQRAYRNRA